MKDDLFVNEIIELINPTGENLWERIIWIDENYTIAFVFDIYATKGFPKSRTISEIQEAITQGIASKVSSDPYSRIIQEEELSDKVKEIREKAWGIVSPLVEQEPSIYYRHLRGGLVKDIVTNYNKGKSEKLLVERTVYKYLRKFWQRGKTKNSLLPDYDKCGGKGKTKKSGSKKRGRPRKYAQEPEIGEGVNITESDKKIFRLAITRFYNNPKKNSLRTAYQLMIKEFYKEEVRFDEKGIEKSILIPPSQRPTFNQFKYWYQIENKDIKKSISSRKGTKKYALEHRAITGSSKAETIGPGSRYQIDATIADIYLVSQYKRSWIIGRPVIYVVIDVFSRMITGVYIGLEGPSWTGAMMALANAASDKVKFCQEYGIEITEDEWCCHHIPDAILGDRGELAGMKVETLIPNLHIRIENAASYRADWKGLVERHFRTLHTYAEPFVPGYVDTDSRVRGGRDYRLDSKLDIEQLTQIIIHLIRYHNNHHFIDNYERDEAMIAEDVPPIPVKLWKWGIANRSGKLRTFNEDIIKLNLMPTSTAKITPKGISFKGMYYTCERAEKEYWFAKARSNMLTKAEKYLDISYDVRKPNFIYLRSSDGRDFDKCTLIDPEARYSNHNLHEIEYLLAYEELQRQKNEGKELQYKVDVMAELESIVSKASQMTEIEIAADDKVSKRQKISGIRENRSSEKSKRREFEGFELTKTNTETEENTESDTTHSEELQPTTPSETDYLELLKKNRQELRDGKV